MALPPEVPRKFLTFHGKRYEPLAIWNDDEGLLQDPLKNVPHSSTKDLKLSSSFVLVDYFVNF